MSDGRNTDGGVVKISRTVSIGWLFSIIVGIAGWGISNYIAFTKWAEATQNNVEELKRIATQLNVRDVKDAGVAAKLEEHERRIGILESNR